MTRRQRSIVPGALVLTAAPAFLLMIVALAVALQRWRWERVCVMVCGPYLPADVPAAWLDAFRRAMDWHTPLAVAAAAAAALTALVVTQVVAQRSRTTRR